MCSYAVMIDAIHADAGNIPAGTPKVAGYVTGTPDIQWTSPDWARFPSSGHVRIDQSAALAEWASGGADVADVESGAATQASAVAAALEREKKGWWSFIYVAQGNLAAMQTAVAAAKLTQVQYWVAAWDADEVNAAAMLGDDIIAVQWASPSSNPDTTVPGSTQTLSQANVDLSVTIPSWFAYIPPAPVQDGLVVTAGFKTYPVVSHDEVTWLTAG
jgi:hypothetical protein